METFRTVRYVAQLCEVTEATVRRWIKEGKLEATRPQGTKSWLISDVDLEDFLDDDPLSYLWDTCPDGYVSGGMRITRDSKGKTQMVSE